MSHAGTPLRRPLRGHGMPFAAVMLGLSLALPASAAATPGPIRQASQVSMDAATGSQLSVMYPTVTTLFNQMTPDGNHIYLDSPTDLNHPGVITSHAPWDVSGGSASRIVPLQQNFVGFALVTPDNRTRVIWAGDPLTGVDDPGMFDLYVVHDGVPKLASAGTASDELVAKWVADDGSRMVFTSMDNIAGTGDTHAGRDLYIFNANTNQISLAAPGIDDATFVTASPDGQHVIVGDPSGYFEKIGGVATQRAIGTLAGFSADSSKLYFTTDASLVPADTDGLLDGYYSTSDGAYHLMNLNLDPLLGAPIELSLSADASHWILGTDESLSPADTDLTEDWYVGSAGGWVLIPGGLNTTTERKATANFSTIVWKSVNPSIAGDTDGTDDLYTWSASDPGTTRILTSGTQNGAASHIRGLSTDGSRIVFSTDEKLTAGDTDGAIDIYRWEAGSLTLLSPSTPHNVTFDAVSANGQRVVFDSVDPILAADTNPSDNDHYISDPDGTAPTATAPKSSILAGVGLDAGRPKLRLSFSAADVGSGVARVDVAQSTDGGAFVAIGSDPAAPWSFDRLVRTGHTYRFRVRAVDNAGNVGAWATGLTTKVTGVQQSSSAMRYRGTWKNASGSIWWGTSAKYSTSKGATVTYKFTGKSIGWVSLKGANRGKANVYVNGVFKATVNLYNATTQTQRVVWSTTFSTSATRTLTIKVLGTTGRPRVDFDGVIVGT
jgi:hypothetical protein